MRLTVPSRLVRFVSIMAALLLVLTGFIASSSVVSAQDVSFDCSGVVANGGFEDPQLGQSEAEPNGATSWNGSYRLVNFEPNAHGGTQFVSFSAVVAPELSQMLSTSD